MFLKIEYTWDFCDKNLVQCKIYFANKIVVIGNFFSSKLFFFFFFFCQLTNYVITLRRGRTRIQLILQNYKAQRCAVFLKIPYLSGMKKCSRHADLFVRLFSRAITSEVPPPKV